MSDDDDTESAMKNEMLPRTVLVTGAAGFIGSHVVDRLLSRGCSVWGVDNFDPLYGRAMKEANLESAQNQPRFRIVEGDLRDESLLGDVFSAGDFDAVIHLAARAGVRPSMHLTQDYYDCNVMATVRLLETMRRFGVGSLVFGSSSSVYGAREEGDPFAESSRADRPLSPYAATKRAAELACHTYWHLHGIRCLCLRLFTVYGPRQRPDLAIHKFTRAISDRQPVPLYGDGSSQRDYTYVDDVVDAVCAGLALVSGEGLEFDVVNIGANRRVRLSELVDLIGKELDREPLIRWLPPQPGDVPLTWADIARARELMGYEPKVRIEEGVRRFVEWFREASQARLGEQPSLVGA